jgi:hypothetical protein
MTDDEMVPTICPPEKVDIKTSATFSDSQDYFKHTLMVRNHHIEVKRCIFWRAYNWHQGNHKFDSVIVKRSEMYMESAIIRTGYYNYVVYVWFLLVVFVRLD